MLDNAMLFVRVAQMGSLTKAADVLYRSKSSISRKLSQLEQELSATLLQRTPQGIRLTKQGEQFYQTCLRLQHQFEEAKENLHQQQRDLSGHIAITAPMSLGSLYIGPLVGKFLKCYPEVSIELELSDKAVSLESSHYDLAIRAASALPDSSLHAKTLFEYDYVIAGANAYFEQHGYPKQPQELSQHQAITCITTHDPQLTVAWPFSVEGQQIEVPIQSRAQVTHMWVQKQLALDGVGLIRVPRYWVNDELEEGALASLFDEAMVSRSNIYALYQAEGKNNRRLKTLIDYLATHLPNTLSTKSLVDQAA